MPQAFAGPSPAAGRTFELGREYHLRMRAWNAGSPAASTRVSSAAAASYHSRSLGRQAPRQAQ